MQIVVIILLAVGLFAAGGSVGWKAAQNSRDAQELAEGKAKAESLQAAAGAIAKIDVRNVTIRKQAETIVREKTIYAECKNTPEMMGVLNQALSGSAK